MYLRLRIIVKRSLELSYAYLLRDFDKLLFSVTIDDACKYLILHKLMRIKLSCIIILTRNNRCLCYIAIKAITYYFHPPKYLLTVTANTPRINTDSADVNTLY